MKKGLAIIFTGIMVLSVMAVPGVAQTTAAGGESPGVSAVDTLQEGSGNHSLSIPGRSYASAPDPGSSSTDLTGQFAIEFWIRYNESSDEDAIIMTKGGIPGDHPGNYQIRLNGDGDARNVRFAFNDFAGALTSNSEIPAKQWTHVAFTYDGSTQTIYLNGEKDAQRSEGSTPETTDEDFHIGVDDTKGGHFLNGSVDDVRLWGDTRTLIEIENNMLSKLDGTEQGLQALYQFDESGLNDQVGSSDLTASGSAQLVSPDANLGGYAPPFLHATPGNDSVDLTWTKRSAGPNTGSADAYKIYRSQSPTFKSSTAIATVAGSATSYTDTDVSAGTTYYYQIRAVDADGNAAGYSKSTVARPYEERGGGSLDFDGRGYGTVSDRPSVELGGRGDFSVEFWLKFNESSDEDAVVFTKGGIPGDRAGSYTAYLGGTGEARQITFNFNNFAGSLTSNTEIQAGQWTHVAFTFDGSTQTLYLNGNQDAQRSESSRPERNPDPLQVGVDDTQGGHFLNGSVDDLRFWSDSRERSEVRANYRNRLVGNESGLMNYWRFNDIGATDSVRSSESKKSLVSAGGDAAVQAGGAYPVAPYVFATSENAASNVTYKNRMGQPLDSVYYQFTVGDSPTAGVGTQFQPSDFTPRDSAGLTNGVTYEHYLQAEVDGQRSDFQRPATSTPYAERGGASLSVEDGSYGTVSDRPTLDLSSEFTVSFWVKYRPSSDEDAVVLSKGGKPGGSSGNYMAYLAGTGEDRPVQFTFNNFHSNFRSNSGIPANVWTHVAYTYDGSTRSIYINGELDAQGGESSNPEGVSAPLRIGTDQPATGHYLDGHVDELKVWNDTRTDQELENTFVNGFIGNESGLDHYWRFDDAGAGEARGSTDWHATVETRDGATLAKPGVLPVPPRVYARGEAGQSEVVWRVRNRPDDVYVYASSNRDRSDRQLATQADADRRSVFVDRQLTNGETQFYQATSLTRDGQESDYSFPASALPSAQTAGNAFEFNGQSSYITAEDRPALDIDSDFSISFWVKYNETSDEDAVVLSKGGTPGSGNGNYMAYLVGTGASRNIYFGFNDFFNGLTSNTAINASDWTHVAFTHDGSTQSLYIDGELDAQQSEGGSPERVSAPLRVGADRPATGHYLKGQVDELRISDDPGRSKVQIEDTFDNELVGDEVGLIGYWRGCYSQDTQDVWGHARRPMTATFTDISCVPSTVGLGQSSVTSTFNVTLDGGTNGLGSYLIRTETNAETAIRTIEPDILGGDRFDVLDGGPGERNATVSASEETGIVGPSDETRTLYTIEYSGNVTRDDLTLDVMELSDDNFSSIPDSAVSMTKVGTSGDTGDDSAVPVSLSPTEQTVGPSASVTYDVVISNVTGGVGSADLSVSVNDTGVAEITGIDLNSGFTSSLSNTSIASDGSSVSVQAAGGDTADTGSVTVATVTVSGVANGTAALDLTVNTAGNESAVAYTIGTTTDGTVSVEEMTGATVIGSNPTTDGSGKWAGDGVHQDINGDGSVTLADVTGLFANYNSDAVQNNPDLFDFNGDGTITLADVTALFNQVTA